MIEAAVDCLGKDVFIGDTVLYAHQVSSSGLKMGVVKKITPCGVTLENRLSRGAYQIVKIEKDKL